MAIVIPYVKQTHTDGIVNQFNAARANYIEEGILDASLAPCVRVFHNASQSIASSATPTALAFNSERFDQAGGAASTMHDTVTNNSRLTAIYAGVYQISGNAVWASSPTNGQIWIRHQGTTDIATSVTVGDYRNMNISTLYALAVNEYVELRVAQVSGSAVNINTVGNYTPEFMMVRVG